MKRPVLFHLVFDILTELVDNGCVVNSQRMRERMGRNNEMMTPRIQLIFRLPFWKFNYYQILQIRFGLKVHWVSHTGWLIWSYIKSYLITHHLIIAILNKNLTLQGNLSSHRVSDFDKIWQAHSDGLEESIDTRNSCRYSLEHLKNSF